jgi:S-adenosylmethionine:tRNA ribosyltransferase-isomerase
MDMYNFELPDELIAQEPASPRDSARLLVFDRATETIKDDYFYNILDYLPTNTRVVANNSKVEHCRYLFDNGKIEIFAVEKLNDKTVRAMVRPGKRFKLAHTTDLGSELIAKTTAVDNDGIRTIEFSVPTDDIRLVAASHVPLPPYIAQNDTLAHEYQTVYANPVGSLAAPTAGLHFTPELMTRIKTECAWAEVTLHVGLGTFAPLKDDNFTSGRLHSEQFEITKSTAKVLKSAPHITAVGTTSCRTIETSAKSDFSELSGGTDIFIRPGYEFKRVNSLITNFHLPSTSLLLMIEAFLGNRNDLERIYEHAIAEKYRFYSFGDAMLIL